MNPVIKLIDDLRGSFTVDALVPVIAQSFLLLKRSGVNNLSQSIADNVLFKEFEELNSLYEEFGYHFPLVNVYQLQPFVGEFIKSIAELYKVKAIDDDDLLDSLEYLGVLLGKKGMTNIPREVVELGKGLLPETRNSVYCPFEASYSFAEAMEGDVGYEAQSLEVVMIALTRSELLNKSGYDIRQSDPLSNPKFITQGGLEQFEHSIAFLPFNLKLGKYTPKDLWGRFVEKSSNGYVYQLRHMLAHSQSHVVACISNSFLTSSVSGEAAFKKDMLEKGWLKGVVALPGNLLNSTGIPFSLLVLDKNHQGKPTLFIDANHEHFVTEGKLRNVKLLSNIEDILNAYKSHQETDFSALVSVEDIKANNMSLTPGRYVMTQEDRKLAKKLAGLDMINLVDVVEFIRPQMVKSEQEGQYFKEIVLSNLNEIGQVKGEFKRVLVKQNQERVLKQVLKEGDVLLSCRGTVGRVGLIDSIEDNNLIASQMFTVIRVKPDASITPEFVYQYLVSDVGQWQLSNLVVGSAQSVLSPKDLNAFQIPELPVSEVKKADEIRSRVVGKYQQLDKIRQEIKDLNDNLWFSS